MGQLNNHNAAILAENGFEGSELNDKIVEEFAEGVHEGQHA